MGKSTREKSKREKGQREDVGNLGGDGIPGRSGRTPGRQGAQATAREQRVGEGHLWRVQEVVLGEEADADCSGPGNRSYFE